MPIIRRTLFTRLVPFLALMLFMITSATRPAAGQSGQLYHMYLPLIMSPPMIYPIEQQVVDLVNQHRRQQGCSPLAVSRELTLAARNHSADMAINDYFDHYDQAGHSPGWRAQQAGYSGQAGWENIAAGSSTAADVVNLWMNSEGHRRNILNCTLRDIGVGYYLIEPDPGQFRYETYWTQDFGRG